jgi:DNA-binding NarL/FixJ family response regulator
MGNIQAPELLIYVCSRNPIAVWAIKELLAPASLNSRFNTWLPNQFLALSEGIHLLLIDASSVLEWPEVVRKWTDEGHRTILLAGESCDSHGAELRALHLGVRGIVHVSRNFSQQLSDAISSIIKGQLFAKGEILNEFYYGAKRASSAIPTLSFREEQSLELLLKGFSNRRIGTVLGISERTAKFHVCNILRKLHVSSRRELVDRYSELLDQPRSA